MRTRTLIIMQGIFVVAVLLAVYLLYPKASVNVSGNTVRFSGEGTIEISENPDFSNSKFIDLNENASFELKPGKYYWRASNSILESSSREFEIKSEVGMEISGGENEKDDMNLVNVGNVKINVIQTKEGIFVGNIILEPNESEEIEEGEYKGRQE